MPWQTPNPFKRIPFYQIFSPAFKLWFSNLGSWNNFDAKRRGDTAPGEPWQNYTDTSVSFLCKPEGKLPESSWREAQKLIDFCIIDKQLTVLIVLRNGFYAKQIISTLQIPNSPWAPPKYSRLWNE